MAQKRHTEATTAACFALCVGLCILAICTNADIINGDDEAANENTKHWSAVLSKSKPQFGFERGSRSHGKPTFIRFGKRNFNAYNSNLFNTK